jgi:hypothetical protein
MGASLKKLENLGNISLFLEIYQKNEGKAILWDSLAVCCSFRFST